MKKIILVLYLFWCSLLLTAQNGQSDLFRFSVNNLLSKTMFGFPSRIQTNNVTGNGSVYLGTVNRTTIIYNHVNKENNIVSKQEIQDSLKIVKLKSDFAKIKDSYKILIVPDITLTSNSTVLIKGLLEQFARDLSLPLNVKVIDSDFNLKHNEGTDYYMWLANQVEVDAIITPSFEQYKTDSVIGHLFYYCTNYLQWELLGKDTVVTQKKNTRIFKITSYISTYPNKIAVLDHGRVFDKRDYYQGSFLNEFKCELLRYFIEKNEIDFQLETANNSDSMYKESIKYLDAQITMKPKEVANYVGKLNFITQRSTMSYYDWIDSVVPIAKQIILLDSLHFGANYLISEQLTEYWQFHVLYGNVPVSIDSINMCIRRMEKSQNTDSLSTNALKCIRNVLIGNYSLARKQILEGNLDRTSFTPQNYVISALYLKQASVDSDVNRTLQFIDSSIFYLNKEESRLDSLRFSVKADDPNFPETMYECYSIYIYASSLYLAKQDTVNFKKFIDLANNCDKAVNTIHICWLIKNGFISDPFSDMGLKFSPNSLNQIVFGKIHALYSLYYTIAKDCDGIERQMNIMKNFPYEVYELKSKSDSSKILDHRQQIWFNTGVYNSMLVLGSLAFDQKDYNRCIENLSLYFSEMTIDPNALPFLNPNYFKVHFDCMFKLYQAQYLKGDIQGCLITLTEFIELDSNYRLANQQLIVDWLKFMSKNKAKFGTNSEFRELMIRFKKLKKIDRQ